MKNNQKGFGVIEILLVIVVVFLVGFAGWYALTQRDKNKDENKNKNATSQNDASKNNQKAANTDSDTKDWKTFTSEKGMYTFKYPKDWVLAEHLDWCAEGLVLFASNNNALGTCASESGGQMSVYGVHDDLRDAYQLNEGYINVTTTAVTADGIEGEKIIGVASGQGEGLGAFEDGVKVTYYLFYTNGMTYVAAYTQQPSYPDASADFEKLVTKTLIFSM